MSPPRRKDAVPKPKDGRPSKRITIKSPISELLAASMPSMATPAPTPLTDSPLGGLFDDAASLARKRAAELVQVAKTEMESGNLAGAVEVAELICAEGERAPPPGIDEVIEPARPLLERIFQAQVGSGDGVPAVVLEPAEIASLALDHRTGFLLSRIDGVITIEELLEVSGMGVLDSLRILSSLLRERLIEIR